MVSRRELRFDNLSDAAKDAENLLAKGYEKLGNWSLSQVCDHMTDWLTYPIDGFPKVRFPISIVLWVMKKTVGRKKFESYLTSRSFPTGKPTMPKTVHPASDDATAVKKFIAALDRFAKYTGPVLPSPLFGAMTKDEADRMHCVHAAHHLSFLVPKA